MTNRIAPESMQAARQYYADNAQACIDDAVSGRVFVNDLPGYIIRTQQAAADDLAGKNDHTFTMRQRAYSIQTGKCVALLP